MISYIQSTNFLLISASDHRRHHLFSLFKDLKLQRLLDASGNTVTAKPSTASNPYH